MASLLLVDDDEDLGDALADVLRWKGHDVRVARNGREGLILIEEQRPDLLLVDVEMPVLSGPEMVSILVLRAPGLAAIPVAFLSGIVGLAQIAERIGTPYFLAKPYRCEDVLSLVERAMEERIPAHPRGVP